MRKIERTRAPPSPTAKSTSTTPAPVCAKSTTSTAPPTATRRDASGRVTHIDRAGTSLDLDYNADDLIVRATKDGAVFT